MAVSNEAWRGSGGTPTSTKPEEAAALMQRLMYEVKRVVVGQDAFLERVLIALLAQGHLLIEGVPGLAKTLTVNTLAKTLNGSLLPRVSRTTEDTHRAVRQVGQTAEALGEQPQTLLWGKPPVVPGPGERGFVAPAGK